MTKRVGAVTACIWLLLGGWRAQIGTRRVASRVGIAESCAVDSAHGCGGRVDRVHAGWCRNGARVPVSLPGTPADLSLQLMLTGTSCFGASACFCVLKRAWPALHTGLHGLHHGHPTPAAHQRTRCDLCSMARNADQLQLMCKLSALPQSVPRVAVPRTAPGGLQPVDGLQGLGSSPFAAHLSSTHGV
jgi:hypothetical protein